MQCVYERGENVGEMLQEPDHASEVGHVPF